MYYEIFDEIRHAVDNKLSINPQQLINKSFLDSFYELRSEIQPIYNVKNDRDRLIQKNYPYLITQKIINGISKAIFLGLKPGDWMDDLFLPTGRMKVPATALEFELRWPCLYVAKKDSIAYQDTHLQRWETEFLKLKGPIGKELGFSISSEGFRSQLNRILEIIYGYRHDHPKRARWVEFLHELIIHGKTFTMEQIKSEFDVEDLGDFYLIHNKNFKTLPYLEYIFNANLGRKVTTKFNVPALDQDARTAYSTINHILMGQVPLCHFSIGELMFIAKDEYLFNQYYDWYIRPWTESKEVTLYYMDNDKKTHKEVAMHEFPNELKKMKYAIVHGFKVIENGKEFFYSAEPKMLKD